MRNASDTRNLTLRETARVTRVVGERFTREQTLAMSRAEYRAALAAVAAELYA